MALIELGRGRVLGARLVAYGFLVVIRFCKNVYDRSDK